MEALYEEHARQIREICPSIQELENPTPEQLEKLRAVRDHCLRWCIQEWEWAYRTAEYDLRFRTRPAEPSCRTCYHGDNCFTRTSRGFPPDWGCYRRA